MTIKTINEKEMITPPDKEDQNWLDSYHKYSEANALKKIQKRSDERKALRG
jgi:hypothetical protein